MRPVLLAATTLISTAAIASTQPMRADQPTFDAPARPWTSVDQAEKDLACRDRIQRARDTGGHPQVRSETANPDKPLFVAAVDRRIDGCSVMVMRHDTSDIRPLPKVENRPGMIPAR